MKSSETLPNSIPTSNSSSTSTVLKRLSAKIWKTEKRVMPTWSKLSVLKIISLCCNRECFTQPSYTNSFGLNSRKRYLTSRNSTLLEPRSQKLAISFHKITVNSPRSAHQPAKFYTVMPTISFWSVKITVKGKKCLPTLAKSSKTGKQATVMSKR